MERLSENGGMKMTKKNETFIVDTKMKAPFPEVRLDYPISPKENLKLVLDKKKPCWAPNMSLEKGMTFCPHDNDRPGFGQSGLDWFGVSWTYVDVVGGQMVTPDTYILKDPLEWEEKLIFPDLDQMDFSVGAEEAEKLIDPDKLTFYLLQDGLFERLLSICDPTDVFCFLMEEPESAKRYFNRMADYKIALMDKVIREWAPFDAFINSDDWGTQISTFISPQMYREYMFEPMKRITDFAHSHGKYIDYHSCGKVETLVPQMVELGADMWEAQRMNDLVKIKEIYGNQLPLQIPMDPEITTRPDVSDEEIIAYVRKYIEDFGQGGGLLVLPSARDAHVNELIAKEAFRCSMELYR